MADPRVLAPPSPPRIGSLVEMVGYAHSLVLYEVQFKRQEAGWLAVLKATGTQAPLVAFVGASTLLDAVEQVLEAAEKGGLSWRKDKYPPRKRLVQLSLNV